MGETNIYVPINIDILLAVEEIRVHLESNIQIHATQQEIIENAIVALQSQLYSFFE